jgi:hypothetical protein
MTTVWPPVVPAARMAAPARRTEQTMFMGLRMSDAPRMAHLPHIARQEHFKALLARDHVRNAEYPATGSAITAAVHTQAYCY